MSEGLEVSITADRVSGTTPLSVRFYGYLSYTGLFTIGDEQLLTFSSDNTTELITFQ